MITIGIIGANSQVGTETCLFLSGMENVRVVPICRGKTSSVFLRRCGLDCRIGSLDSAERASELLADCDVVADFSLPRGASSAIRPVIDGMIGLAMRHAPTGARYVYISTIMAFGMPHGGGGFRPRRISRTLYGATKRHAERLALRLGRELGREVWALRLGQVHGELQEVSRQLVRGLLPRTAIVPRGPSYTVFVFSIAEALVQIGAGREPPGTYTLVSSPEWAWAELLNHYADRAGVQVNVEESVAPTTPLSRFSEAAIRIKRAGIQIVSRAALGARETVAGYGLHYFPEFELKLRAAYHRRRAVAEIDAERLASSYRPFADCFQGRMPGKRLLSLSDSRCTMAGPAEKVRYLIDRAGRL